MIEVNQYEFSNENRARENVVSAESYRRAFIRLKKLIGTLIFIGHTGWGGIHVKEIWPKTSFKAMPNGGLKHIAS